MQPYKGKKKKKEREARAADTVQTANKGRWDEGKRRKRKKAQEGNGETKAKVAFREEKRSGRRENNVIVKVETKRDRHESGRAAIFPSQRVLVVTEAFLKEGKATVKFIFKKV